MLSDNILQVQSIQSLQLIFSLHRFCRIGNLVFTKFWLAREMYELCRPAYNFF